MQGCAGRRREVHGRQGGAGSSKKWQGGTGSGKKGQREPMR